jgi:D-3-phosphoglycerate dehydrogenase
MPRYKIVITDFTDTENLLEDDVLRASGLDYELVRLNCRVPAELAPLVADADALMVQFAQVTRPVIESLRQCKVISRYGIGVDMVDLQAAGERGIPVANVPDFCIDEVSTHTLAFILNFNRRILPQDAHIKHGLWGKAATPCDAPTRLSSQVLGIVGLGNIGRTVARQAACLGLKVIASDPYLRPDQAASLGVELVGLEDLLSRADYVSLHCPLVSETRHLIGAAQLAMMKPSAYLLNLARGPVVDQPALYQALVTGTIAGAALDVLDVEPPSPDEPLLKLPNVILTLHTASWSAQSIVQLRRDTAANVVDMLQGRLPRSIVNRKALGWTA